MNASTIVFRPQKSPARIFPTITANFYIQSSALHNHAFNKQSPDEQAASFIVSLAQQSLNKAQMLLGRKLTPQQQLTRLLIHHRLGFEAELIAQWPRADFYWQQTVNQVKSLSQSAWQALADDIAKQYPGAATLSTPLGLRQCIVEEIFIDTHCGFFNTLNARLGGTGQRPRERSQLDGRSRSFAQTRFIEQLLPYASLPNKDWLALTEQSWQQQINPCRDRQNWQQAVRLCKQRLVLYPWHFGYQTELIEAMASRVLSSFQNRQLKKQPLLIIRCLKKGISQFESLAQTYPGNLLVYDYLGNFYHLYAVELAQTQQVAQGLAAVEKAIAYVPSLEAAKVTRDRLTQTMKRIQAQAAVTMATLGKRRNLRLNAQGIQIQKQAKKGFTLRDKYLASSQPAAIKQALERARVFQVWHQIPELPPDPEEPTARALAVGLGQIIRQPPLDKAGLLDEWTKISQSDRHLASLPVEPIRDFLAQKIWKKQATEPIITPPPTSEVMLLPVPEERTDAITPEPFFPWLYSRQSMQLKAQVALSLVALLLASSLWSYEYSVRRDRTQAYAAVSAAVEQNQLIGVIEGAEAFLSRRPISGKDSREAEVKALYSEAITALFMQQTSPPEEGEIQRFAQRYQELM